MPFRARLFVLRHLYYFAYYLGSYFLLTYLLDNLVFSHFLLLVALTVEQDSVIQGPIVPNYIFFYFAFILKCSYTTINQPLILITSKIAFYACRPNIFYGLSVFNVSVFSDGFSIISIWIDSSGIVSSALFNLSVCLVFGSHLYCVALLHLNCVK